jgi:hypothetical protein
MIPHSPQARLSRRAALSLLGAVLLGPATAIAAPRRIRWADLIPPGIGYGEIVGQGFYDTVKDIWIPEFDVNGSLLNTDLDGQNVSLAGYMIPLDFTSEGVTDFVLVPFVGACIHVPPPPPNQLVFVTSERPFEARNLWDAVLVSGRLGAEMKLTAVAQVGYTMQASALEDFRR